MTWLRRAPKRYTHPPARASPPTDPWADLDRPLCYLSPHDPLTFRDLFTQVHITGGVGSGKSSGSIALLVRAMLAQGFGLLCTSAKPDDADTYTRYALESGRERQIIRVTPDGPWAFAWLSEELQHAASVEDVVHLISAVTDIVEGKRTDSGDPFWQRSAQTLVRNAVSLLQIAGEHISLDNICTLIRDAPNEPREALDEAWQQRSYCATVITVGDQRKTPEQAAEFKLSAEFFLTEYASLADRTRSSIITQLTSMADILRHGYLRRLLGSESTFTPEWLFEGAIILLDLPTVRGEANRIAQGIIRLCAQRAILRRRVQEQPRPVGIVVDEAQEQVSPFDYQFLALCRSSRCANIFATQSITNYHARMGSNAKSAADALLSLFQLHVFHKNHDITSNTFGADLIAKSWVNLTNTNISHGDMRGGSHGSSTSLSLQHRVLPGDFTLLRSGGPLHGLSVDAIVAGKLFSNGQPYLRTTFKQQ